MALQLQGISGPLVFPEAESAAIHMSILFRMDSKTADCCINRVDPQPIIVPVTLLSDITTSSGSFASQNNTNVPLFLARLDLTMAGSPDAFMVDCTRWNSVYLFPPPTCLPAQNLPQIILIQGQVLLIAPRWPVQPWFQLLCKSCPDPAVPLPHEAITNVISQSQASLSSHVEFL